MREPIPGDADLGERLVLDADRVRVWEDQVPAGASQPLHTHTQPYLSVIVAGARGEIVDAAGTVLYRIDRRPGEVAYFGPDRVPSRTP